jgi:hypothetical protein
MPVSAIIFISPIANLKVLQLIPSFSLFARKKKKQKENAAHHLFRFQRNSLCCS